MREKVVASEKSTYSLWICSVTDMDRFGTSGALVSSTIPEPQMQSSTGSGEPQKAAQNHSSGLPGSRHRLIVRTATAVNPMVNGTRLADEVRKARIATECGCRGFG